MTEPLTVVPAKPDAEIAASLKTSIANALGVVCLAMDEANAHGFDVAFNVGVGFAGRNVITNLKLTKPF